MALKVNTHQEIRSAEDRPELAVAAEEGGSAAVQKELVMLEVDLQKGWQRVKVKNFKHSRLFSRWSALEMFLDFFTHFEFDRAMGFADLPVTLQHQTTRLGKNIKEGGKETLMLFILSHCLRMVVMIMND